MKKKLYSPPRISLVGLAQHLLTVLSAAKGGSGPDYGVAEKKSWVTAEDELSRESDNYWDDYDEE